MRTIKQKRKHRYWDETFKATFPCTENESNYFLRLRLGPFKKYCKQPRKPNKKYLKLLIYLYK